MIRPCKKLIIFVGLIIALALPQLILAANNNPALDKLDNVATGNYGPYNQSITLMDVIGSVIQIALGLLGVIFLILMIYAGYNWMSAQGEEEKVSKAKDTIVRAVIGLIIVVGSYAIWMFIFSRLF